MSVRAYRIVKMELAVEPSFNLWSDVALIDFMKSHDGYYEWLNEEGTGTIEISVDLIEKVLSDFDFGDDRWEKESLEQDMDFAKSEGRDYVLYQCF